MIATSSSSNKKVADSPPPPPPSLDDCQKVASSLLRADELPLQCRQLYPELIRTILERRNSRQTGVDPFEGMWSGSALSARAARAQGKEYHAQIQRRLTSTSASGKR